MTNSLKAKSSPVELQLRKQNLDVTCVVRHQDDTTEALRVESVMMRGAQMEVTTQMVNLGYRAVTRWETTEAGNGVVEAHRVFRADG